MTDTPLQEIAEIADRFEEHAGSGAGATITWHSASHSDMGRVRHVNEDAFLDSQEQRLWVVADGMGGHEEGELASQSIVEALSRTGEHARISEFVNDVEDRLLDVHESLVSRAVTRQAGIIGSTVAVLLAQGHFAVCLWAGDSRVYRYRDGALKQITQDHSLVEELVKNGGLQRDEAESHPDANVINRAIGADQDLCLDVELLKLHDDDRYLICSDGLYKEVNQDEIAEYMRVGDCTTICNTLVALALERGANDNVTVVVVKFDQSSNDELDTDTE